MAAAPAGRVVRARAGRDASRFWAAEIRITGAAAGPVGSLLS